MRLIQNINLAVALVLSASPAHAVAPQGCFSKSSRIHVLRIFEPHEKISARFMQMLFGKLTTIYSQDMAAAGGRLNIYEDRDMDFQAFADRERPGEFSVKISKGVRYHQLMTEDAYALIACHEIGHHMGGLPLQRASSWATVEGEADYFANLKCMRRYFESLAPLDLFSVQVGLPYAAYCEMSYSRLSDMQICGRSMQAAQIMGEIIADNHGETRPPSLNLSDATIVGSTRDDHPSTQCRLDTYGKAALCGVPWGENLSGTDLMRGVCHVGRDPAHSRPTCWFAVPVGNGGVGPR